jgi:hypothetical protein
VQKIDIRLWEKKLLSLSPLERIDVIQRLRMGEKLYMDSDYTIKTFSESNLGISRQEFLNRGQNSFVVSISAFGLIYIWDQEFEKTKDQLIQLFDLVLFAFPTSMQPFLATVFNKFEISDKQKFLLTCIQKPEVLNDLDSFRLVMLFSWYSDYLCLTEIKNAVATLANPEIMDEMEIHPVSNKPNLA